MLFIPAVYAGHHVSESENRGEVSGLSESEFNVRVFKKLSKDIKLMGELKLRNQEDNQFQSLRLGSYYRAGKNFKLGFFYSRESGLLHDSDWERVEEDGKLYWGWKHTDKRVEQIYTIDGTYRVAVSSHTVFELKNRYSYNSYNHQQFLRIRPGVTYFWKKQSLPFMNLFLQHETYHPLSGYTDKPIYEQWIYLGVLYHLSQTYKLGAFVADKQVHWESGTVHSFVSGLNLIINY